MIEKKTSLYKTPFLELVEVEYKPTANSQVKKWFGASRIGAKAAVVILAITENREMIFVRQPRPMSEKRLIELPAGLMDKEGEEVLETAERELLEETGFTAKTFEKFLKTENGLFVSPGLSDEKVHLVIAKEAKKVAEPLENEFTEPIIVPLKRIRQWVHEKIIKEEIEYKAALISLLTETL